MRERALMKALGVLVHFFANEFEDNAREQVNRIKNANGTISANTITRRLNDYMDLARIDKSGLSNLNRAISDALREIEAHKIG